MKIAVKNFRGCASAEIEASPIALVGGQNEAGKSSLSQAVIAALTGQALPVGAVAGGKLRPLVIKGDAWRLVTAGGGAASATITGESGSATVKWPECEYSTAGAAPTASIWAAGGASIVDLDPAGRVKVLTDILDARPKDVPPGVQDWLDNAGGDWDGAHAAAAAHGQQLKGEWRAVTGEQYGSAKAKSWRPDGYDGRAVELLSAELSAAQAGVDMAVGRAAVSVSDLRRDRALAERVDELTTAAANAAQAAAKNKDALDAAQSALDAAPHAWGDSGIPCPWCGANVRQNANGELEKVEIGMSREEHDKIFKARAAAEKARNDALGQSMASNRLCSDISADLRRAQESAERVAAAGNRPSSDGSDVDAAKATLAGAKMRLAASDAHAKAHAIAERITENQSMLDLLAPTGLRQAALDAALGEFNARLASICGIARWLPVKINADMSIERDGLPYALVSASAQYRARVAIQLAIAAIQSSSMVVIDGFDILDKAGRNGLLRLLKQMGITALLTATFSARDVMPDLSKIGGRSYWIEDGVAE